MTNYKNLIPGQYQIDNYVIGKGTNVIVEQFDAKPYDVNAQDYQLPRSDEIRFGFDQLKPTTVEIQMQVIYNRLLEPFTETKPNFWHGTVTVDELAAAWRGDSVRYQWGEMLPLFFCGRDGIGKILYGRPGTFGSEKASPQSEIIKCVAEFRRADTLAYSADEQFFELTHNEIPQLLWRGRGDAATWVRIVGEGPITNPRIYIGEHLLKLDGVSVAAGESFEISSYPWQRRAVKSDRTNIRGYFSEDSAYLDRLSIPVDVITPCRWTSDEVNTFVPLLGSKNWAIDMGQFWEPPPGFTNIVGKVFARLDLINPTGPGVILGGGNIAWQACALYTDQSFGTAWQNMQARIAKPFVGRSAMVMMSNNSMTDYVLLEVATYPGNQHLRIRTGSGPTTWSTIRDEWTNNSLGGWKESDTISFHYNPDTKVYSGKVNGVERVSWTDSINLVATGSQNRKAGFIFDMDGTLFTIGCGFKDIFCYDSGVEPAQTGKVYVFWRDAWSSVT